MVKDIVICLITPIIAYVPIVIVVVVVHIISSLPSIFLSPLAVLPLEVEAICWEEVSKGPGLDGLWYTGDLCFLGLVWAMNTSLLVASGSMSSSLS